MHYSCNEFVLVCVLVSEFVTVFVLQLHLYLYSCFTTVWHRLAVHCGVLVFVIVVYCVRIILYVLALDRGAGKRRRKS